MIRTTPWLLVSLSTLALAVAACSSTAATSDGSGGGSTAAAGTTTGAGGGETGSGGSGGMFDPGGDVTTIESGVGPIDVASGVEKTQCVTIRLDNAEGGFVRRFRAELTQGSHHMIVYRSSATQESPTPVDCQGFSGLLSGSHPIFIAQQADAELVFPKDENGVPVGFQIDAHQMVRIELHYINTTPDPIQVAGKVHIDTVPLSTNVVKSDLAFWGTKNFTIPANGTADTGVRFQAALPDTKVFALTTHQHQLGTRMRVWYASDANDTSTPVADSTNWSDPPIELFSPALDFPADPNGTKSTKGFAYECEWKNPTPNDVKFGEGFNDEMCFLWHYYYPSQGFQLCIDGFCPNL